MKLNLDTVMVVNGGELDLPSTLAKVAAVVQEYHKNKYELSARILGMIHGCFNSPKVTKDARISAKYLESAVLNEIRPSQEMFGTVAKAIKDNLTALVKAGILEPKKGPGGGMKRVADWETKPAPVVAIGEDTEEESDTGETADTETETVEA